MWCGWQKVSVGLFYRCHVDLSSCYTQCVKNAGLLTSFASLHWLLFAPPGRSSPSGKLGWSGSATTWNFMIRRGRPPGDALEVTLHPWRVMPSFLCSAFR